ncbi:MAG: hypothetical protein B7X86_15050 [Sphingobacteriales bacterium 17-39-43]|uniref:DUF423 domain-containing protein n=1 Tax=Daejeonella sp. TaxID=2805397 RepID=UPI000BD74A21|nr:DUF423 domain-containing protein [Daejeonella sp.]OYZ29509.1 MAG: hypothetical protein B7Y24_14820 [Sphingobacteriales bacterium 16-39-50]OZA22638.1 MAG: hypothetical protein B7X86_15050 [Sphingobacteriales bacterium 17-39-43]HQT24438.1 DUF423 domain-containing protein [Daejeonella sp.]HQT58741.1 DUF423 domain-containing protein [Daejeonella sp.]
MNKQVIIIASVFGILAVILGAFGAHALKSLLDPAGLEVWKTAVSYHFYHTLALLFVSILPASNNKAVNMAAWFFSLGILLFSGSLYLISTKEILNIEQLSVLGPITPIGGLFFILGWFSLIFVAIKSK